MYNVPLDGIAINIRKVMQVISLNRLEKVAGGSNSATGHNHAVHRSLNFGQKLPPVKGQRTVVTRSSYYTLLNGLFSWLFDTFKFLHTITRHVMLTIHKKIFFHKTGAKKDE